MNCSSNSLSLSKKSVSQKYDLKKNSIDKKELCELANFFLHYCKGCVSRLCKTTQILLHTRWTINDFINTYSQFVYFGPQIKFCGWAYKVVNCTWNFMPISKNRERRRHIIEVQITN